MATEEKLEDAAGEDGVYLRSVEDAEGIHACLVEHGAVGVTGVLGADEAMEVMNHVATLATQAPLAEGQTYEDVVHEVGSGINRYGVIGKTALFTKELMRVRTAPGIVKAYAAGYGTTEDNLVCCVDRVGWMRPTQGPQGSEAYATPFSWPGVHLDNDPRGFFGDDAGREAVRDFLQSLTYNDRDWVAENNAKHDSMGQTLLGVVNLLPNAREDGGFHFVPGSHRRLEQWTRTHAGMFEGDPEPNGRYIFSSFGHDLDLVGEGAERIPCPAGSLILFDTRTAHGTAPNCSANSRAVVFLRYLLREEMRPWINTRARNTAMLAACRRLGLEDGELERMLPLLTFGNSGSAAGAGAGAGAANNAAGRSRRKKRK